jgi:hypothetical protein
LKEKLSTEDEEEILAELENLEAQVCFLYSKNRSSTDSLYNFAS